MELAFLAVFVPENDLFCCKAVGDVVLYRIYTHVYTGRGCLHISVESEAQLWATKKICLTWGSVVTCNIEIRTFWLSKVFFIHGDIVQFVNGFFPWGHVRFTKTTELIIIKFPGFITFTLAYTFYYFDVF